MLMIQNGGCVKVSRAGAGHPLSSDHAHSARSRQCFLAPSLLPFRSQISSRAVKAVIIVHHPALQGVSGLALKRYFWNNFVGLLCFPCPSSGEQSS